MALWFVQTDEDFKRIKDGLMKKRTEEMERRARLLEKQKLAEQKADERNTKDSAMFRAIKDLSDRLGGQISQLAEKQQAMQVTLAKLEQKL